MQPQASQQKQVYMRNLHFSTLCCSCHEYKEAPHAKALLLLPKYQLKTLHTAHKFRMSLTTAEQQRQRSWRWSRVLSDSRRVFISNSNTSKEGTGKDTHGWEIPTRTSNTEIITGNLSLLKFHSSVMQSFREYLALLQLSLGLFAPHNNQTDKLP